MPATKTIARGNDVIAARPRCAEGLADFFLRLEDDAGGDINTVGYWTYIRDIKSYRMLIKRA